MKTPRSRLRLVLGLFAIGLLALGVVLRTQWAGAFVCTELQERLGTLEVNVGLGRCAIDPLTASVEISEISIAPRGSAEPFLTAGRAAVSLRGLFLGGVSLQDVEIIQPRVDLKLPLAGAGSTDCPLRELSRVRVGRLRIVDGSVSLMFPQGQSLRLDGLNIDASLARSEARAAIDGRGGSLAMGERTLRLGKLALEGSLDVTGEQVELQRVEGNLEGVRLTASGIIDGLCDPFPTLNLTAQTWLPVDALPRLGLPVPEPSSGQILARAAVVGRLDTPSVRGELQATRVVLGSYAPGDFSARASWTGKTIKLEELLTRSGEGEVRVSAELSIAPGFPLTARVETKEASFARIMARAGVPGSWVEFPASASGVLSGFLSPTPMLSGDIEFRTGRFTLAARPWDSSKSEGIDILGFNQSSGRFRFSATSTTVAFEDVSIGVGASNGTRVVGSVKLFPQRNAIDADVMAESIDLSDFGSIAELPWSGLGQASVSVRGPFESVKVDGHTTLRDFKLRGYSLGVVQSPVQYLADTLSFRAVAAQKGQTQYFGDVALQFKESGLHARATVQLPDGRVEDVIDLLADLSPTMQNIQDGVLVGRMSALMAIDSPVRTLTGVIATRARDVRCFDRRLGEGALVARFEGGEALVLEPAQLSGPMGKLKFDGRWDFEGPLDYRLTVEDGSLRELIDPGGERALPVSGEFRAEAKLAGTTDRALIDGSMSSDEVTWKQRALGPLRLEAKADGREVVAQGTVFRGLEATLSMTMRNEWPFQSKLSVQMDDLSAFFPESAPLIGVHLKGTVDAKGPMRDFSKISASAKLSELGFEYGEVTAANTAPVELALSPSSLEVISLELKGPTTELSAAGNWGPANIDLKTRGSMDLRLLSSLTSHLPVELERTQGRLDFTAAFAGPVASPSLAGSASIADARFQVRDQDLSVRALSARADFSESRVIIQEIQGFLNEGRIRGRGDLRLERLAIKALELQTDLEEVLVHLKPEAPMTLSGSLLLASRNAKQFQLSGDLDVIKFRYREPITLGVGQAALPSDAQPTEWLRLDVDLRSVGDVRIESNLVGVPVVGDGRVEARLAGKLKLSGTNAKPVLLGIVETHEGAQAAFQGATFDVQRGQLQFNGLWPTFDFSARSQVRDYLISVKGFGRFEDPKASLSSDPALPDIDILSLLLFGATSREQITPTSGAGYAAKALLSASGLDQLIQRFLSKNVGLKDQQVRLTTTFNPVTGTTDPAVTWEAKVLSEDLKVGVTQPVTLKGTKAQAEYRINQNVSARAQWDNQNQTTTYGNPGVELRIRFEWE